MGPNVDTLNRFMWLIIPLVPTVEKVPQATCALHLAEKGGLEEMVEKEDSDQGAGSVAPKKGLAGLSGGLSHVALPTAQEQRPFLPLADVAQTGLLIYSKRHSQKMDSNSGSIQSLSLQNRYP